MKTTVGSVFILLLLLAIPVITQAQPGFGDDVDDVPVDGGLILLIATGIGYGIRKAHTKRAVSNRRAANKGN